MKKISKLALLAAATALLFGAIGCSDEDEDPTPAAPAYTVEPASFELTSGADAVPKPFKLTLNTTQFNEEGLAALKKSEIPAGEILAGFVQQSGSDITVSNLTITKDATATTLEFSLTMTSSAKAGSKGTLSLTLPGDFTTNGEDITGTIPYTIKESTATLPDGGTPATVWDWSTATEVPCGIGTTKLTADSDNIPLSSGSGATIKALKGSQFANPTSGQGLKANGSLKSEPTSVNHTKAGSSGLCKSWLEFTLSADATVKIEGAATNITDYRCIILTDSSDTIIEMLHSTTTSTGVTCPLSTTKKLNAGTYYIGLDGAYISKITCE